MKYFLEDMLETIALALLMFLVLQVSVRNYRVELSSMEATLFPKDRLVVNKLVYAHVDSEIVDGLAPFVDIWDDSGGAVPVPPRPGAETLSYFDTLRTPAGISSNGSSVCPERRWRYTGAL